MDRDKIRDRTEGFDLREARLPDFYPADDVLVEIGRVAIAALAGLGSQDELDELVRERGRSARYTTLHPRSGGPGPQEIAELDTIRADLEDSKNTLARLRFVLASALFAGSPAGAKKVLPLKYHDLRTEPGRSGWRGLDELSGRTDS